MAHHAQQLLAGLQLHLAGRCSEAQAIYREVLDADASQPDALHLMGVLLCEQCDLQASEQAIRRAIAARPAAALFHNSLGETLYEQGRTAEAIGCYRQALQLAPDTLPAHTNLARVYSEAGRRREAIGHYREAIRLAPDFAPAHCNLGNLLRAQGNLDEAVGHHRTALELDPKLVEARVNLSNVLRDLGHCDEAIEGYREALAVAPELAEAHCNLGRALRERGNVDEAIACHREAIRLKPTWAEAHYHLARAMLTVGDLRRGWDEYRWRGRAEPGLLPGCPQPHWDGSPLDGKTILVISEQNLGTQLLFASALPDLIRFARHGRCVVACECRLVSLYRQSFPDAAVYDIEDCRDDAGRVCLEGIDVYIHLGSLPGVFRNAPENFPRHHGYLRADLAAKVAWQQRLQALGPGLKVGISWRGGAAPEERRKRTIELARWGPVLRAEGVYPVSVQYGDITEEIASCRQEFGLELCSFADIDPLIDIDGFAALIAALDLVVSVDNSTAHLAGGLGVPTWNLLPAGADWRWMFHRDDSPWFPAMQLMRQQTLGDWDAVLRRVGRNLRDSAADRIRQSGGLRSARPPMGHSRVA